jgi:hypothetical protein
MQGFDRQAAFRMAVLDLSQEPTPTNVRRYLAASRLLERERTHRARLRRRSISTARQR